MKRLLSALTLFATIFLFNAVFGQKPELKVMANSVLVEGEITLSQTKRLSFLVYDGMPLESGYAYTFGEIYLVKPSGERIKLQDKVVQNGPIMHFSLYPKWLKESPEGFTLELTEIDRFNPNNTTDILFANPAANIKFIPPSK